MRQIDRVIDELEVSGYTAQVVALLAKVYMEGFEDGKHAVIDSPLDYIDVSELRPERD